LDAILAYTCTAEPKTREQFFKTAFQQFMTVSREISTIYSAIEDDADDAELGEMPTLDQALSRPKLQDVTVPIRKSRALGDILIAMSPALADDCLSLFLSSVILNFNSPSELLQKKAYQTVQAIITTNHAVFEKHWNDVLIAISTSSSNIQSAAHRSRILLCRSLYSHLQSPLEQKDVMSTLPALLSEAILATKESNNKLATAALDLTIAIGINIYNSGLSTNNQQQPQQQQQQQAVGSALANKNQTGQQLLTQYLAMVLAGLAASTPRMLSATINVVARLVFEFKSVLSQSVINDILQTVLILLPSKSREILKSILAFIKVAIVTLPPETLKTHIHDLLFAISDWRPQEKSHFKRPVRILYQLLMKKFGLEFMRSATPPDDLRLVEYLRKQQVRQQNQKERERKEQKQQGDKMTDVVFGATKDKKNNKMTDGEDDNEDDFVDVHRYHAGLSFDEIVGMDNDGLEDELGFSAADMLQRSVKSTKKGKKAKFADDDLVQLDDHTDFLDTNVTSKIKSKLGLASSSSTSMGDGDMGDVAGVRGGIKRKSQGGVVNTEGKLDFTNLEQTIKDEEKQIRMDNRVPTLKEVKEQRKRQRLLVQEHKEEKMEKHAEKNKLKLGSEFTSTKGVGDVKRRGMKYDPYAYVPLDPRTLNTKKLSLRQQSKHFAGMFEKNAATGGTASARGPGQRLSRGQRTAMRKKGGKYNKNGGDE
jgi:ribosomal RNA-processing protein 12